MFNPHLQDLSVDGSSGHDTVSVHSLVHRALIQTKERHAAERWDGPEACREAVGHEGKEAVGCGWCGRRGASEQCFVQGDEDPGRSVLHAVCGSRCVGEVSSLGLADAGAVEIGFCEGLHDIAIVVDDCEVVVPKFVILG